MGQTRRRLHFQYPSLFCAFVNLLRVSTEVKIKYKKKKLKINIQQRLLCILHIQRRIAEDISIRKTVKLTLSDNWWVCTVVVFFTHNLKVWHCWRLRNLTEMPTQPYWTVSVTISRLLIVLSQKKSEHFLGLFTSPDAVSTIVRKVLGCAKTFSNKFHHYVSPSKVSTQSKNATPPEMQYVYSSRRQLKPQTIMIEIRV